MRAAANVVHLLGSEDSYLCGGDSCVYVLGGGGCGEGRYILKE